MAHHKYCAVVFEQLNTQALMSLSTPCCCWQRGSTASDCPKGLSLHLHSRAHCQLLFPLAVYGVRESILSQGAKHVKRRFHMWNWDLENNHLASLSLIYFPYDGQICIESLFFFSLLVILCAWNPIMNNMLRWELTPGALSHRCCMVLYVFLFFFLINE